VNYPQGGYPPQNYPPQGYGPQQNAPGYGPPQGGYAPQAQYAPPQQAAPAPGYGGPNPNPDEFGTPDAVGGIRPRLKDAGVGRLVLVEPVKIERGIPNRLQKPDANGQVPLQDRMTANVVFLDGPPFMYGGDPDGDGGVPKPHTMQANIPHEARSMWITNPLLIAQCERSVGGGKVLGRLTKGEASRPGLRPPWKLADPTEPDRQIARDYLRAVQEGRIQPPTAVGQPTPQNAPAGQPYPQNAAPMANAQVGYPQGGQGGYVVTGGGGGASGYVGPTMAYGGGAAPGYEAGPVTAGGPPAPPQYGGIPQGAPVPPPAAAAVDLATPPPGWAPEVWATVPEDQRQMIVAANAARPGI
jgi:hypothetical protein